MTRNATRDQIIDAADRLFYEQGFEQTSFADISAAVGIARGNISYHFKTKDEILDAVIQKRLMDRQEMLDMWEADGATPEARIRNFIRILIVNQSKIMLYGCPIGTLSTELAKLNHPAQGQANALFTLFRDWLKRQFALMGRTADADTLAMQLLARSQGVATLATAFRDKAFVEREVVEMEHWLTALSAPKILS
ncbi:TetR/AcrR family transcriptional regulator [Rhodospirillaceae bacterium KN72]|uniref:TetR/AcrR family transcriptional regulator n=1 Tax=Pacificispira spongiicola TaxID=2729598 RepID=A0A7Y0E1C7_9PROT|nr:TetR/AcrR family transcriptional regulator [Pacificispira spongiicola]NMM45348.1 TetR/AcrR family transcriptional regulator [Pacificispira spongiicola]